MRTLFTCLGVALIIVTPYWVYLPVIVVGIVVFPLYVEAIILALLVDVLYGMPRSSLVFDFPFGMIAALLVLVALPLRESLRLNA